MRLGTTTAESIAREGQGFIAFNPRQPSAAPTSLPPSAEALSPSLVNQGPTQAPQVATRLVSTEPDAPKGLAREVLPVLALVIGIPFLVWMTDRSQQKKIRG